MVRRTLGPFSGREGRKWLLPLSLVFLLVFILSLRLLSDNNLGFHLHGGQWIVEHGTIPQSDSYTYAAEGREYVDLHWLFQTALYGCYRVFGYAGLSVLQALLSTLLLALLALRLASLGAGPAATCWVLLASAVIMNPRFLMRPENVTFIYLALQLIVLDRYAKSAGGDGGSVTAAEGVRRLWPVLLIQLFWVNTQGLFILGWIVTAVYGLSVSARARRADRPLAALLVLSVLICLLNPYGARGLLFPFELLSRFDSSNVFAEHIVEFFPLWSVGGLFSDRVLYVFALALAAALAATWRKRKLHEFLLPLLFFPLAVAGVRNIPLFVIVSAPVLGAALSDAGAPLSARLPRRLSTAGSLLCCAAAAGLTLRVLSGAYYAMPVFAPRFRFGVGLDGNLQPAAAGEFLREHGLKGRLLNSSNTGGWLGWATGLPVYSDGRLEVIREDLFQEEVDSWEEGGLETLIAKYRPQLIVLDYLAGSSSWLLQLREREDWRLVHVDEIAAIYAHRDYQEALPIPAVNVRSLPSALGVTAALEGETAQAILNRHVRQGLYRWLADFVPRPGVDRRWAGLGKFSSLTGEYPAAEQFYLLCLKEAPDRFPGLGVELGNLYLNAGFPEAALLGYEWRIRGRPRDASGFNGRGIARARLRDFEGAFGDFSRAISLSPDSEAAFYNRGLVNESLGDREGALRDYSRALEINPGHGPARERTRLIRQND